MKRRMLAEATWHTMDRGVRRLDLFRDDSDRRTFLEYAAEQASESRVNVRVYTLMDNHFHLQAASGSDRLGEFMQVVKSRYSRFVNRKYGLKGATFEGPYRAYPASSPWQVLKTAVYILLNPVSAGIVKRPEEYPWSSYGDLFGSSKLPLKCECGPLLDLLDGDRNVARREFMELLQSHRTPPHASEDPAVAIQE